MSINPTSNSGLLIEIDGIEEPTIAAYFSGLNSGEFAATAELFAENGRLDPPFENPIEGREAIAKYLETEAKGMIFCPESGTLLLKDNDLAQYHVQGKVKTNYFTINVSWLIQLNTDREILLVEVKLLAALEELLKFSK
ncbi:nuclear transport factor 2 family protein [Chamaesiphon polymorphus]|uniref:Nuclear transport factor 2 n=1 Tax=Chamaesiphon polymorphus CCALA 037 TaxID=2107692 RepID=A0A2T1GH53_9CYAN|nr:nuclear transport factor 2 family protein [Chamaesiphon polymorphus]PSB56896.1 nuclear transport factor 2 [Chamaesiphon polymorphus CCALA 037]